MRSQIRAATYFVHVLVRYVPFANAFSKCSQVSYACSCLTRRLQRLIADIDIDIAIHGSDAIIDLNFKTHPGGV